MDEEQRGELVVRFPKFVLLKRVINLEVSDTYYFMQPELIEVLKNNFEKLTEPLFE